MVDVDLVGPHPVIVLSREPLNRGRDYLAVFCTSAHFDARRKLPNCIPFRAGRFGFSVDCVAQCDNILTVDRSILDGGPIGVLDELTMRMIIKAIGYVIESDCEPV